MSSSILPPGCPRALQRTEEQTFFFKAAAAQFIADSFQPMQNEHAQPLSDMLGHLQATACGWEGYYSAMGGAAPLTGRRSYHPRESNQSVGPAQPVTEQGPVPSWTIHAGAADPMPQSITVQPP